MLTQPPSLYCPELIKDRRVKIHAPGVYCFRFDSGHPRKRADQSREVLMSKHKEQEQMLCIYNRITDCFR